MTLLLMASVLSPVLMAASTDSASPFKSLPVARFPVIAEFSIVIVLPSSTWMPASLAGRRRAGNGPASGPGRAAGARRGGPAGGHGSAVAAGGKAGDAGYDWDAAEAWLREAERATGRGDDPLTRGQVVSFRAGFALWRGKPVTATRLVREAISSLLRHDPQRRLPLAWLYLIMSTAMHGDLSAARQAEAHYRALVAEATVPYQEPQEARAYATLAAAEGRTSDAARMLLSAAASEPIPVHRGHLLYHALRAGAEPKTVAPALQAVAASCDAPLIGAFARQAAGSSPACGEEPQVSWR
jgi:hypothetical protein